MKTLVKMSVVVLFISFLSTSCKKDESLSDLDTIEQELKSFTSNKNITKCTIREFQSNGYFDVISESPFSSSNGFIVVTRAYPSSSVEYRYNLLNLYNYYKGERNILYLEFVKN